MIVVEYGHSFQITFIFALFVVLKIDKQFSTRLRACDFWKKLNHNEKPLADKRCSRRTIVTEYGHGFQSHNYVFVETCRLNSRLLSYLQYLLFTTLLIISTTMEIASVRF